MLLELHVFFLVLVAIGCDSFGFVGELRVFCFYFHLTHADTMKISAIITFASIVNLQEQSCFREMHAKFFLYFPLSLQEIEAMEKKK